MCSLYDITKFNEKINIGAQLEKIIQSIPDPMIIVDENLEIHLINNASLELRNINPSQIRDSAMPLCSDVFRREICNTPDCPMQRLLHSKEKIRDLEVEILDYLGKKHTFFLTIIPLQMSSASPLYLLRYSDITAKKEYEHELKIYQQKLQEENIKLQEKIFEMKITPVHEKPVKVKAKTGQSQKKKLSPSKGYSLLHQTIPHNNKTYHGSYSPPL